MIYSLGDLLTNKYHPGIYYLITEATTLIDGNFVGEYFYRYIYMFTDSDRVVEPNQVIDQCFYSFHKEAANFSLATNIPKEITELALDYTLRKIDMWNDIYNGISYNYEK
jgi:hypothetical protein